MANLGNRTSITTGDQVVAVPGTAEQLPSVTVPEGYAALVTGKHLNTQRVYIGGSAAEAEAHTVSLGADDVFSEYVTNLNAIWIDVDVAGEGIDYEVAQ